MKPQTNPFQSGLNPTKNEVNPFTRRSFMKTSALTVGAMALLSRGKALAEGRVSYEPYAMWGMLCTNPQDADFVLNFAVGPFSVPFGDGTFRILGITLTLETRAKDPAGTAPYNYVEFSGLANTKIQVIGVTTKWASHYTDYKLHCDSLTGAISGSGQSNWVQKVEQVLVGTTDLLIGFAVSPTIINDGGNPRLCFVRTAIELQIAWKLAGDDAWFVNNPNINQSVTSVFESSPVCMLP